ncbi:uncharacterized protein [Drosophila tropicalis]|uniref:uncharacterized protein n=1 Tax=Drosophila tropicalis TaxID=46794 RepID=UPI0035AB7053
MYEAIGYADDVAIVVVAKELEKAGSVASQAIASITRWLQSVGLALAADKTDAVLISTSYPVPGRLCFREHLENVQRKAASTEQALSRLMRNTRGPKQERRLLLMSVLKSVIFYAAQICDNAIHITAHNEARNIADAKRNGTLKQTASGDARMQSFATWQERWDSSTKIRPWFERKHGQVTFHLTQFITGHGCFRSYLYRIGHEAEQYCLTCGEGMLEAFFACRRFTSQRRVLEETESA